VVLVVKLSVFIAKFERFVTSGRSLLIRELSTATERLVTRGFLLESDPYGNRWKPQKNPHTPILYKTGDLFRSFRTEETGTGFRLVSGVEYGIYHQTGTYKMPARKLIPSQSMGMSALWMKEYERVFGLAVRKELT
jgi:phage gpG-like protein